jgi:dolichyl-phosphate beta-glucosyltransferase
VGAAVDVSWIIPTYRDELKIERTLREVDQYLASKSFPGGYEIVVVGPSDGDGSAAIAERVAAEIPAIRLLRVEGHGKGSSVRRGMLSATGAFRVFSDADNATAPPHFDRMLSLLRGGHPFVVGSRHPRDAPGARREVDELALRRLGGVLGNLYIRLLAGVRLRDTQNGFKGFTGAAAEDLFSSVTITGFAFDVELLVLARLRGYDVGVMPVEWRHEPQSSVTAAAYLEVFRHVTAIGLRRLLGVYRQPRPRAATTRGAQP